MASISFGQANSGFQVGVNQGPIYLQQENGTRVNIGSSSAKTTNEKIKEAIGARLGSSPRKKNPYPGTCEWLGTIQNFRHWITDEPPSRGLLWICGGPGKGKSHLSTHLVARLEIGSITTEPGSAPLKSELGNDRLVLSYFCDASDILHSTELAVVLGLLNQLLEWKESEELYSLISPKFSGRGQDFFSSSFIQDLWDCFEQMIRVISKNYQVYLVLDGLDECNSSSQAALSGQMRKICDDHQQNENHAIKVVIFSRPLDLCHQMDLRVDLHTANSLERTKEDIRMIVEASCRLQQEDQEHFCNILTERAKGTFLWVALAISLLKDTSVQQKVVCENSAFLDQLLPIGLDAMYNRMLFNIIEYLQGKSHGQDMMRIFHCLTFSQRPLTIKEVGVLTECNDSIVQDALYAFDHILSTTEGGLGEDAIELIHVSLREYLVKRSSTLISEKISWFFWPYLSFTPGSLRENRFQLWFLDYAILATLCFHFQGFLRRHSTLGFGIFSITLCYAFQRFRSSLLIDLIRRALERLMTKLLMVIFCVKTGSIHLYLFERCIAVMSDEKSGLKRDIHDAESPQHLQNRLETKERWRRVQYPSRYWVAHLKKSESKLSAMDKVDIFLKQHFLHWLEVLAHLGIVSGAVGDLSIIKRLAQDKSMSEVSIFLYDAKRFLLQNRHAAEVAPLQIYSSGLVFAPLNSIIRKQFQRELRGIRLLPKVEKSWGAELQTLEGHSGAVRSVAFSPDGQSIASGSDDMTIKIWDAGTGQELRTLSGHLNSVQSVAFSPDSQTIASGSYDNIIKLWNTQTGQNLRTLLGHSDPVKHIVFSPNSRIIASSSHDNTIKIWNFKTGQELRTLPGYADSAKSMAFFPNDRTIASISGDNTIKLWNTQTGQNLRTQPIHSDSVRLVAFAPDGQTIALGSPQEAIKIWDAETDQEIRTLMGDPGWVLSMAFSPDSQTIASTSLSYEIKLWDKKTGRNLRNLRGHSGIILSMAFSPDGGIIASGSNDNTIRLWDTQADQEQRALPGHSGIVTSLAISPDGQTIISGSTDETVKLWDTKTGQELRTLPTQGNQVHSVAFSPDGQTIVSGAWHIKLWDFQTSQYLRALRGHTLWVRSIVFSPDGQIMASGSEDETIKLWDTQTGQPLRTLYGLSRFARSIVFSPDGRAIASGSNHGTVKLWDARTGQQLRFINGHHGSVGSLFGSNLPDSVAQVSVESQWVYLQNKAQLWLPTKYRSFVTAAHGGVLALGYLDGGILIIGFDLR